MNKDESINTFIDTILKEEEATFRPGLEPFQVYAAKMRHTIHNALVNFEQKLQRGVQAIRSVCEEKGYPFPHISAGVKDGKRYITGFSKEDLRYFYQIAYQFTHDKHYEQGRDAFFFLVTITPQVADFWLGLAICETQLQELGPALQATLCAIECDPTRVDPYLHGVSLYLKANERDKAAALCKQGIDYGLSHPKEPWSLTLVAKLRDAQIVKRY